MESPQFRERWRRLEGGGRPAGRAAERRRGLRVRPCRVWGLGKVGLALGALGVKRIDNCIY